MREENGVMDTYSEFLRSKRINSVDVGIDVPREHLNPKLFDFQKDLTAWALSKGRAALFEDCGLGKSPQQLEWANQIHQHTGGNILILAPLAVSKQTRREGEKFNVPVHICRTQKDVVPGVNITNYEMLEHFDPAAFTAIVLDESSILKGFGSVYRKLLTQFAATIPYRLCCTATPAPNDLVEIINHAEFLGIMNGKEIIALFFTQDGNTTHAWRLKGHAKKDFWSWMATWAVAVRKPSDLGYDDGAFTLPAKKLTHHLLSGKAVEGYLIPMEAQTLNDRRNARRASLDDRVEKCAELVAERPDEQWLLWCDLNAESEALTKAIPGAVEVKGSDSTEHKEKSLLGFADGTVKVLVSKASIAGFGLNFQSCHNMAFVGLSDSFEQFYQAIRRCWRFGQREQVNIHVITSESEQTVVRNIARKEMEANMMMDSIVEHMSGQQCGRSTKQEMDYLTATETGKGWTLYLGDAVEEIQNIPDESVGLCIFSPPFPGMYTYTNSTRDMGNCKDFEQMIAHFQHLIPGLYRITMPGRSCCIHLTQAIAFKGVDGYVGMKDFRGRVIKAMEELGWIYYGETTIDKNPQVKAIRTRDSGLQFKSLATDSSRMHMALADYLLQFRKPGDNVKPIRAGISQKYKNPDGWISQEEWILWARPVWYGDDLHPGLGIRETDVLNVSLARETDDERHLCPLQLGVIERAVKLWTNPGETVFSPFAGVGSEGYQAIRFNRKFIGIELKPSYHRTAVENLKKAVKERDAGMLFEVAL